MMEEDIMPIIVGAIAGLAFVFGMMMLGYLAFDLGRVVLPGVFGN